MLLEKWDKSQRAPWFTGKNTATAAQSFRVPKSDANAFLFLSLNMRVTVNIRKPCDLSFNNLYILLVKPTNRE